MMIGMATGFLTMMLHMLWPSGPGIAIGGIGADNILSLKGSGICGIAVVSAIFASEDIENATKVLRDRTEKML